ncbi:bile acid:sodium symporter family protein [Flavobacteriaceae bacterium]|nr:bile acid:sodium symporter family protein [Flavobacteriaceae bacterium]
MNLDALEINFSNENLWVLNIVIAIIMFGVALDITVDDFKRLFKQPKIMFVGVFSQFIALPFVTYLFVLLTQPMPSIALGLMLIGACPGGNISNFLSKLSGGNAALSVSLTAFATVMSIVMTPFNLEFYGNLYPPTREIMQSVELDPYSLFKLVLLILGIPLILGMVGRNYFPKTAVKLSRSLKPLSIIVFIIMILGALAQNYDIFMEYIHHVFLLVISHNLIAILLGLAIAILFKLSLKDRKTISIETGIQNGGLGLLLIFQFFEGLGGMALLAAFWGVWDIFSGLAIAYFYAKKFPS